MMGGKDYTSEFNKLFTDYHNKFVRFANNYVRDRAVAEDFVTDSLIYYWENRSRLPDDVNTSAYILTAIKNKCLSHLRHIEIQERILSNIQSDIQWELSSRINRLEAFEPNGIFTQEIQALVEKTLFELPGQTQKIFHLSRNEYLSHREIAQKLDISLKSVEFHITKAIKALRIGLKDYVLLLIFFL